MVRPLAVIASRHGTTWDVGDPLCQGLRRAGQEGYLRKRRTRICASAPATPTDCFTDRLRENHVCVP